MCYSSKYGFAAQARTRMLELLILAEPVNHKHWRRIKTKADGTEISIPVFQDDVALERFHTLVKNDPEMARQRIFGGLFPL